MNGRNAVIVVPCYNEAERFDGPAWLAFASQREEFGFLFVNDGSTDDTGEVLARMCRESPGAMASLDLPSNRGKAEAVRVGLLEAMASEVAYVGFLDADLATPLDELDRFVHELDHAPEIEIVLGSRMDLAGHEIRRPWHRLVLGIIFSALTRTMLRFPVHDTQCGAKMFRVTDRIRSVFQQPFRSNWIFDLEILSRYASLAGKDHLRTGVYEMPLNRWKEVAGSKLGLWAMIRILIDLLGIWWRKNQAYRPNKVESRASTAGKKALQPR
jgi:dolichyl-phosphate beta-glucosyltransferase